MIGKNFDTRSKNIDVLFDMLVDTQKRNGVEPTLTDALFDPNTKERINVFKRKKLESEGVDLSKYGESVSCKKTCNKKCGEKKISNIERGIFVYNEDDLIDEEEGGKYVCEFCTKISYDGAYRPELCDVCDDCEECTDYLSNACDGCEYSATFNGGSSYGESSLDTEASHNQEDTTLLLELSEDDPNYKPLRPSGHFTIMDY